MARVVVDPVTRIEGHLRIEAEVDEEDIAEHILHEMPYTPFIKWEGVRKVLLQLLHLTLPKRKKSS